MDKGNKLSMAWRDGECAMEERQIKEKQTVLANIHKDLSILYKDEKVRRVL